MSSTQNLPDFGRNDSRPKSCSPEKRLFPELSHANILIEKLTKKDREIQELRKEVDQYKEKIKEFEFLIIKASDEVKKKQQEINMLNTQLNSQNTDLGSARQLLDARAEVAQVHIQLQKEKELNAELTEKIKEFKMQLEKMSQEAKNSTEQLQKGYSTFVQKYSKLEKENQEILETVENLKEQNAIKDQTITNAHQIIKKLKEDYDSMRSDLKATTEENTELQAKVKEYKGKCKTLKKNNLSYQEQIRELEKKAENASRLEKELEKAKDDLQSFIRSRVDDKMKQNEELAQAIKENEEFKQTIAKLKEEIDEAQKTQFQLNAQIAEEQMKTRTICSELLDREELIKMLNDQIQEMQRNHRAEIEQLKLQAFRAYGMASHNDLPPMPRMNHSNNPSPFKRSPLKEVCPNSDNKSHVERQNKWTARNNDLPTKRSDRPNFVKSTPIKFCSTKGNAENFSCNETFEIDQFHPTLPNDNTPYGSQPHSENANNQGEQSKSETVKEQKPSFTVEFLKDQLQKSMDREHFYALVMEAITLEAEARTKALLERIPTLPVVPPEVEGLRMRCEDLEQRYADMVIKHKKASDLVFDLLANNKILSDKVDELLNSLRISNEALESYSQLLLHENAFQEDLNKDLIEDSKKLCLLIENTENLSNRDNKFNSELIRRLTVECEKYKNEIKLAEEIIENFKSGHEIDFSSYKTFGESGRKTMSSGKKTKRTMATKLNSALHLIKSQLAEAEEEKQYLFRKYSELETELKEIRAREMESTNALREKEKLLFEKDEMIRKRENVLSEREHYITKMNEKFNELVSKDYQSLAILNEKEEVIKSLMIQKQNLIEELERLNNAYLELKKQLKQKTEEMERRDRDRELNERNKGREISQKEEQICALQDELHNMTRELAEKEKEIEQKTNLLIEKDKKIKELSLLNEELNKEISDINYRLAQGMKTESTPRKSMEMATLKYGQSVTERKTRIAVSSEFRDEIEKLKNENKELLNKLSHLNELVSTNKALEVDLLIGRSPLKTVRAGDENMMGTRRSPSPLKGTISVQKQSSPIAIKENVAADAPMQLFDLEYLANSVGVKEEYTTEKENLNRIKEGIKDKDTLAFIEGYKLKTKKVFQKRVKELEMILRYLDLRIRGFNFKKSSYILPSGQQGFLNYDEVKQYSKLCRVVETLLEKSTNLKAFVDSMIKRIELNYIKQHNLTVALVKFIKSLFITSINSDNCSSLNQHEILAELENLFGFKIPGYVSKFDQIETYASGDAKNDFFSVFEKIEPKLNFLNEFLVSSIKDNYESMISQKDNHKMAAYREFLASKLEKLKDMEALYNKLRTIIDRNNAPTLQSLQENLAGYVQTYHNIFTALFTEMRSIINQGLGPSLTSTNDRSGSFGQIQQNDTSRKSNVSNPYSFSPFKNGITSFANYNSGNQSSRRYESPSPTERDIIKRAPVGFNTNEVENLNNIMSNIITQIDNLEKKSSRKYNYSPSFEEVFIWFIFN